MAATNFVPECVGCGYGSPKFNGSIGASRAFAGRTLAADIPGGRLYDCPHCALSFRFPTLPAAKYHDLYSEGASKPWDDSARTDHIIVAREICAHLSGGSILDVGCGSGGLLALLPSTFAKFGIEIGAEARTRATARGVNLVAETFSDLPLLSQRFDIVVASDVIEHYADPKHCLTDCLGVLKPSGLLVFSTGDRHCWLWRLLKSKFWYCQFPEHLAFVSVQWFRRINGGRYTVKKVTHFTYHRLGLAEYIKKSAVALLTLTGAAVFVRSLLDNNGASSKLLQGPALPGVGVCKDHICIILQKVAD